MHVEVQARPALAQVAEYVETFARDDRVAIVAAGVNAFQSANEIGQQNLFDVGQRQLRQRHVGIDRAAVDIARAHRAGRVAAVGQLEMHDTQLPVVVQRRSLLDDRFGLRAHGFPGWPVERPEPAAWCGPGRIENPA